MEKILCHKCNTEMTETDLAKLEGERIDKIIEQIDFPFFVKSKETKIQVLVMGYVFFLCPNCNNFRLIKKTDKRFFK